jgi:hypothetical protein
MDSVQKVNNYIYNFVTTSKLDELLWLQHINLVITESSPGYGLAIHVGFVATKLRPCFLSLQVPARLKMLYKTPLIILTLYRAVYQNGCAALLLSATSCSSTPLLYYLAYERLRYE